MKTYTIDELDNIFKEDTYPYVALFSDTNKMLVPYPANTAVTKEGRAGWERVKKRLLSTGLQDGFYTVKGKSSPLKNVAPDVFCFKKGNVKEKDLSPIPLADPPAKVEHVLTYDAAIKSNKDISELTAEVNRLEMEITQKDQCIKELEEDLSDSDREIGELSERSKVGNGREYIEDLITTAAPILDRHFDLENRKLAYKEKMMNGQRPQQGIPPPAAYQSPEVQQEQQPQRPAPTKEEAKEFWDKMSVLLENDPDEYQRIIQKMQFEQVSNE